MASTLAGAGVSDETWHAESDDEAEGSRMARELIFLLAQSITSVVVRRVCQQGAQTVAGSTD